MFVFDGGTISAEQAVALHPVDAELRSLRFVTDAEAATMLRPYVWRRIEAALSRLGDAAPTAYLEDGHPA